MLEDRVFVHSSTTASLSCDFVANNNNCDNGFKDETFSSFKKAINSSKYSQLVSIIEDVGREIRPSYAGNKISAERVKRGIIQARIVVRECLVETEKSAKQ